MGDHECTRFVELFCELLQEEGYKCTILRQNIIKVLFDHDALSVPEMLQHLHHTHHMRASMPAIYANIKLLLEFHIVSKNLRRGTAVYTLSRSSDHIQLRCIYCHKIIKIKDEALFNAIRQRCSDYRFHPRQLDMSLVGICDSCNNENHLS